MEDREQFRMMRVIETRQRVQLIVVYEELEVNENNDEMAVRHEFVIDSVDRPVPVPYEQ